MKLAKTILIAFFGIILVHCKEEEAPEFNLSAVYIGTNKINLTEPISSGLPIDQPIVLAFTSAIDVTSIAAITLMKGTMPIDVEYAFFNNNKSVSLTPLQLLETNTLYTISITNELLGVSGQRFISKEFNFKTLIGTLIITSLKFNSSEKLNVSPIVNIARDFNLEIIFSKPIDETTLSSSVQIVNSVGSIPIKFNLSPDKTKITITNSVQLNHLSRYRLTILGTLKGVNAESFTPFTKYFYTVIDSTPKFPIIPDEELLTKVQEQTFKYFWDFAHPASGLARERNTSGDVVTIGGSGFGVMALIVGVNRGFITREQCLTRLNTMLNFLETCDRFHGAWPHWLNGNTGKTIPFSSTDDGGDLVETSFMVQGLITMRQYLNPNNISENDLIQRINTLINAVEYDWYTKGENVLYWLWSPNNGYILKIQGYNETLITYFLAASSTNHTIPTEAYTSGYSRSGAMVNGNSYYGYPLPLGNAYGGPLFFTHYSFLGLNPTNLSDQFANYWTQNKNHSLINHAYCVANPKKFVGYGDENWGLTASDNHQGYSAHSPTNDLGVITPTAALSSFPYTPVESMKALKFFYYTIGDRLWGPYGFYDAFNVTEGWTANSYLAIDQGPIIVMIENYRTRLLWDLFMSAPEVQTAMAKLGFTN